MLTPEQYYNRSKRLLTAIAFLVLTLVFTSAGTTPVTIADRHINDLGVSQGYGALVHNPYVDDGYGAHYPWYRPSATASGYPQKTDAEIKAEIQDELWWSPFADADEMGVAVKDGVVTLTGSVDSKKRRNGGALTAGRTRGRV